MAVRFGLGVVALLISGCLSSENGLVPPGGGDRAVFDPALLGDWEPDPPKPEDELKPGEPRFFRVERADPEAKLYRFVAPDGKNFDPLHPELPPPEGYLVAIGKSRYLDVTLVKEVKDGPKLVRIAQHLFWRVELTQDSFSLQAPNEESILKHPEEVPTRTEKGFITASTITATPAQLAAFFERHEADAELWDEKAWSRTRLRRRR